MAAWFVGRSDGVSTSTQGEGQNTSSRDTPGPPDPPSGSGASPGFPFQFPSNSPHSQKRRKTTLVLVSSVTGQLWVESILVSVGSRSQNRQFLPWGAMRSSEGSIIIISAAAIYGGACCVLRPGINTLPTSPFPPGKAPSSKEERLFFLLFSIPRECASKVLFD